jgi:hypothetical protein
MATYDGIDWVTMGHISHGELRIGDNGERYVHETEYHRGDTYPATEYLANGSLTEKGLAQLLEQGAIADRANLPADDIMSRLGRAEAEAAEKAQQLALADNQRRQLEAEIQELRGSRKSGRFGAIVE